MWSRRWWSPSALERRCGRADRLATRRRWPVSSLRTLHVRTTSCEWCAPLEAAFLDLRDARKRTSSCDRLRQRNQNPADRTWRNLKSFPAPTLVHLSTPPTGRSGFAPHRFRVPSPDYVELFQIEEGPHQISPDHTFSVDFVSILPFFYML